MQYEIDSRGTSAHFRPIIFALGGDAARQLPRQLPHQLPHQLPSTTATVISLTLTDEGPTVDAVAVRFVGDEFVEFGLESWWDFVERYG